VNADVAAIARVIADIETAFNSKDPDLAVAHFAPDATAVSASGVLLEGRDALHDAWARDYAGALRDQYTRYELADVRFPRPDVAVAHKRARAVTADGEPLDVGHELLALYVLVRDDGRWRVVARQSTLVT
jgi:uncharacterized protein (TIGR02246 family)